MKTLWNIVSFLAVVHLLALLFVVGWLWQSGRLDRQRIGDLREYFASTTTQAKAAAAKSLREMELERLRQAQDDHQAHPSTDTETQIQRLTLMSQQEDLSRRRLESDKKMLQQQLDQTTAAMNDKQGAFDRQRQEWENAVKTDRQRRVDDQFLQTVKLYEAATPKQGKKMLQELITQKQMDQAVAYLDSMNVRAASKILKEFKTDEEIKLATELLEKLRTLGQPSASAQVISPPLHAADSAANSSPAVKPVAAAH